MNDNVILLTKTRQELTELFAKRKELLSKDSLSAEEFASVDGLNEQINQKESHVKTLKAGLDSQMQFETNSTPGHELVVNGMSRNKDDQTTIDLATKEILHQGGAGLISMKQYRALSSDQYNDAYEAYVRHSFATKGDPFRKMDKIQIKNLEEGADSQGGYLIPPQYIMRLIERMMAPTRVQARVQNFNTGKDKIILPRNTYSESTNTYTTPFRVTWTGENPTSTTQHKVTDPAFGQLTIDVYTAMMSGVLTKDMVEDTDFPIMQWMADKFMETILLLKDEMILNGTGVNQPMGIMTNPGGSDQPEVILSGTADDITADNIRSLPFDLPEQYLGDNCVWVMNRKSTGKKIALFKDSQNRYMWATGSMDDKLVKRNPDTLDGYEIAYSTFMQDVGDGKYPILFGDLMGYYLVNRVGLAITFYYDSAFDLLNQIGMSGRIRFGGKVGESWRMKILKSDNA